MLYLLAFLLCLVPPALAFLFIHAYGVNVAVVDDFFFVDGFTQYFAGNLSPDYFLHLHNDHCLFFGKILMLLLGLVTHFNIIAEMFLSWVFLLLTFFILLHLAIKTMGWKPSTIFAMFPVSLTLFSLRPWDVFLNGSVFLNSMTIFFIMLSVVLVYRSQTRLQPQSPSPVLESPQLTTQLNDSEQKPPAPKDASKSLDANFIAALLTGFIGTFSGSAAGLIIWPIGLLQLLPGSLKNIIRSNKTIIWTGVSALFIGIYLALRAQAHAAHVAAAGGNSFANHLAMMPPYLLTLLGFPMCTDIGTMKLCGQAVLFIYAIVAVAYVVEKPFNKNTHALRASFSIFLFGMFAIALITFGRSERGALEATATRYVQFSEIMAIGAYLMVYFSDFKRRSIQICLLALLIAMISATAFVGYSVATVYGTFWRNLQFKNAYLLRNYKIQADKELTALQSNPTYVKLQAAALERMKLNVFARKRVELDDVPHASGEPSFCVDRIGSQPSPKTPISMTMSTNDVESISISGWAFDGNTKSPAKRIALLVSPVGSVSPVTAEATAANPLIVPACNGLRYPGVEKTFKSDKLIDSGFFASFSPRNLKPGKYQISLAVESSDGSSISESKPLVELSVPR